MQMNFRLLVGAAFCAMGALTGCNGVGGSGELLAKIGNEKVYVEDLNLLQLNRGHASKTLSQDLYDNLYSKAALTSVALKEIPEINKEWEEYLRDVDARILTMVYQRFYIMDCLTYPENELRRFYDANRELFAEDSSSKFEMIRSKVAAQYYLSQSKEKLAEYLKIHLTENPTAADTAEAKSRFVGERIQELRAAASDDILNRRKISVAGLPVVEPKVYYEKHKDEFMTVAGYELYHIQSTDSASLAGLFTETPTLEQFKAAAVASSKNQMTAKDSGYVGVVKQRFSLPYDIGMVDVLADTLEGKKPGYVTGVLRSAHTGAFQRFYLVAQVQSQQKPFERVEASLKVDSAMGNLLDVDSSTVLLSKEGKTLFTEADLLNLNEKFFKQSLSVRTHERILNMVAETYAFADIAKELKLDHSWEYRAIVRDTRWNFISDRYLNKKNDPRQAPEDSVKALYNLVGSPLREGLSYEDAKQDWNAILSVPMNVYKHDYLFGYRMLYVGKTYEQSIPAIFYKRSQELTKLKNERLASEAYANAAVHLYDSSIPEAKPEGHADFLIAAADSLCKAGKRSEAYGRYRQVLYAYADNDELFQKVAYELAQVQNENEEYLDAEAEYYAFYKMWPDNPNAEKAMFSRGFILNENLGMNDAALEVFKEFQEKYPNSELKESVDWLIKNIESNGKLAEDLMKKISDEDAK